MAIEIERKFLVVNESWRPLATGREFRQGYLNDDPARSVRVRIAGQEAWLTVKGPSRKARRLEFEYPVPLEDARDLLGLCRPGIIEKTRYSLIHEGREWVIDEFHGANRGLLLAEIELDDDDDKIALPPWAGREVTEDTRYFNQYLSAHPFGEWKESPRTG